MAINKRLSLELLGIFEALARPHLAKLKQQARWIRDIKSEVMELDSIARNLGTRDGRLYTNESNGWTDDNFCPIPETANKAISKALKARIVERNRHRKNLVKDMDRERVILYAKFREFLAEREVQINSEMIFQVKMLAAEASWPR